MTTYEFEQAAKRAAYPEYLAVAALANIDDELAAERDAALAAILDAREAGNSLVSPPFADILSGAVDPFAKRPAQDDEAEITAAAVILRSHRIMQAAVAAYHRHLSREDALTILNGALCMSRQTGIFYPQSHAITPFAGYSTYLNEFAKDWSAANPEQPEIIGPGTDIG